MQILELFLRPSLFIFDSKLSKFETGSQVIYFFFTEFDTDAIIAMIKSNKEIA